MAFKLRLGLKGVIHAKSEKFLYRGVGSGDSLYMGTSVACWKTMKARAREGERARCEMGMG